MPTELDDADARKPCQAGYEEFNTALLPTFRRLGRGNRLILLAD
jgi:hypothetical protein